jgi:hypothetical protein
MPADHRPYMLPVPEDWQRFLAPWEWLTGPVARWSRVVLLTAFGDWFLEDGAGQVWLLDGVHGRLQLVASDRAELAAALAVPQNVAAWFRPDLVDALREVLPLGPGECWAWRVSPRLGAPVDPTNVRTARLDVHMLAMGTLARALAQPG